MKPSSASNRFSRKVPSALEGRISLPNARAVFVYESIADLSVVVARRIAKSSALAIGERGAFRIALAGGDTPRGCYRELRKMPIDWKHVHVYFGDERCLPRGDARRNDTMAREELLRHVAIPAANEHVMHAERGAQIAAREYAAQLEGVLPLDLILLGMGGDGHTASLFPGNPSAAQDDIVVPVFNAPTPLAERVSLSMGTLNAAREKMFLVAGRAKREALAQIARGAALPAAQVMGAEWHIDRAALPERLRGE